MGDVLVESWRNNTNVILADEMGLGKTVQSVAMLGFLQVCFVKPVYWDFVLLLFSITTHREACLGDQGICGDISAIKLFFPWAICGTFVHTGVCCFVFCLPLFGSFCGFLRKC